METPAKAVGEEGPGTTPLSGYAGKGETRTLVPLLDLLHGNLVHRLPPTRLTDSRDLHAHRRGLPCVL